MDRWLHVLRFMYKEHPCPWISSMLNGRLFFTLAASFVWHGGTKIRHVTYHHNTTHSASSHLAGLFFSWRSGNCPEKFLIENKKALFVLNFPMYLSSFYLGIMGSTGSATLELWTIQRLRHGHGCRSCWFHWPSHRPDSDLTLLKCCFIPNITYHTDPIEASWYGNSSALWNLPVHTAVSILSFGIPCIGVTSEGGVQ